jgi:XTP/dITP diphosphohydrolase
MLYFISQEKNMTIWLASGNKHKQQELDAILKGNIIKLPIDAGIKEFNPEENGKTLAENAFIKAGVLYQLLHTVKQEETYTVLADDSGLCVDALGGRPGIFSARYYGIKSWNNDGSFKEDAGVKLSDEERNLLLLEELDIVFKTRLNAQFTSQTATAFSHSAKGRVRKCRFVCAMVLFFSPSRFYLVQETMEGEIVSSKREIRGQKGFGYDPVVFIPELDRTVAELSEEEKNSTSHRGKAGKAIAKILAGG